MKVIKTQSDSDPSYFPMGSLGGEVPVTAPDDGL